MRSTCHFHDLMAITLCNMMATEFHSEMRFSGHNFWDVHVEPGEVHDKGHKIDKLLDVIRQTNNWMITFVIKCLGHGKDNVVLGENKG